jgi:predicted nucleic acid-binding protein
MMIYLDSNIFLIAILETKTGKGDKARALLNKVSKGTQEACTSYLTWDEIIWKVKKLRSQQDALDASKAFLQIPNLQLLEVNGTTIRRATALMETYALNPRDAIHAASAIHMSAELLSEDKDFDKVTGLKRKSL